MNLKTLVYIIIGSAVFLGIYLFSMFVAFAMILGFGFGIWWSKYIKDIFKNFQKNIYLSEKADMENRKKQLQAELEKLNKGD